MYNLMNLKLKRLLNLIDSPFTKDIAAIIDFQTIKINEIDEKREILKAQNMRVVEKG